MERWQKNWRTMHRTPQIANLRLLGLARQAIMNRRNAVILDQGATEGGRGDERRGGRAGDRIFQLFHLFHLFAKRMTARRLVHLAQRQSDLS